MGPGWTTKKKRNSFAGNASPSITALFKEQVAEAQATAT